jgi:hypothetical protein
VHGKRCLCFAGYGTDKILAVMQVGRQVSSGLSSRSGCGSGTARGQNSNVGAVALPGTTEAYDHEAKPERGVNTAAWRCRILVKRLAHMHTPPH